METSLMIIKSFWIKKLLHLLKMKIIICWTFDAPMAVQVPIKGWAHLRGLNCPRFRGSSTHSERIEPSERSFDWKHPHVAARARKPHIKIPVATHLRQPNAEYPRKNSLARQVGSWKTDGANEDSVATAISLEVLQWC